MIHKPTQPKYIVPKSAHEIVYAFLREYKLLNSGCSISRVLDENGCIDVSWENKGKTLTITIGEGLDAMVTQVENYKDSLSVSGGNKFWLRDKNAFSNYWDWLKK